MALDGCVTGINAINRTGRLINNRLPHPKVRRPLRDLHRAVPWKTHLAFHSCNTPPRLSIGRLTPSRRKCYNLTRSTPPSSRAESRKTLHRPTERGCQVVSVPLDMPYALSRHHPDIPVTILIFKIFSTRGRSLFPERGPNLPPCVSRRPLWS